MKKFLLPLLAAALAGTTLSCSKDDGDPADPAGTAMLNMFNEQNGKTILSDSDIYIDDAGNFVSPGSCQLFMLGKGSGLGAVRISDLQNPAPQVAVVKNYGYVAVRGVAAYKFPSQCVALPLDAEIDANLLRFYVMDNITDPERGTLGAVVKFVIERPQSYWLPEWDSVPYQLDYTSKSLGDEVSVVMPSDNFEAELNGNGEIVCEKRGRNLVFRMIDWPAYGSVKTRYTLRLRVGESYTQVQVEVLS
ncbi:DUF5036 family protein [uncultured Alistipes sp.]|uniref:DUF5036 family protein n=1 Tax=uncultured Alistipes sp. TaxID=538949 RepID=UPI00320A8656